MNNMTESVTSRRAPFSLYQKQVGTRRVWYARYWTNGRYAAVRSTGVEAKGAKGRRGEASAVASRMIPALDCGGGVVRSSLVDYLKDFWTRDSVYFRELAQVQKKVVSAAYLKQAQDTIRLHIEPYGAFKKMRMGNLTASVVRDFALWARERGVSGHRVNKALQVIRIPMRYAIARGEAGATIDPFASVKRAKEERRAKGILTREEVAALVKSPIVDIRRRVAVLLGLLCGMRLGEVRGLRFDDIDAVQRIIHIRHNYQDMDGLKPPKCGSARDVPMTKTLFGIVGNYCNSYFSRIQDENGLMFPSESDYKVPMSAAYFRDALNRELAAIGIAGAWKSRKPKPAGYENQQAKRGLTFHSLRHSYVSMLRVAGVSDIEVQGLAGHKSAAMMDRYSHPAEVVRHPVVRAALDSVAGVV